MISLIKYLDDTWEKVRGYLRDDLDHIEAAINQQLAATFDKHNVLTPDAFTYPDLKTSTKAAKLLGRRSQSEGAWEEISLGSGLTLNGRTLSAVSAGGGSGGAQSEEAQGDAFVFPAIPATPVSLTGYVPYTGATADVDLGAHNLNIASGHYYNYNSVHLAYAQTALDNFWFGNAGNLTATGINNTGMGMAVMESLTTGQNNTAVGWHSLKDLVASHSNTAVGHDALRHHVTGNYNTALGEGSMTTDTDGVSNTAIGYDTLSTNIDGATNTAIGTQSLKALTHGSGNVGIGESSAIAITTGNANIGIGNSSLKTLTTGSGNIGIGNSTADGITTGSNNVIIGGSVTGLAAGLANTVIIADGSGNQRIYVDSAGAVTIHANGTAQRIDIGATGDTSSSSQVRFFQDSTHYNWQVGAGVQNNNTWSVTPSTAVNGTTFSAPLFTVALGGTTSLNTHSVTAPTGDLLGIDHSGADAGVTNDSYMRFKTAGTTRYYLGMSAAGATGNFDLYNAIQGANALTVAKATSNMGFRGVATPTAAIHLPASTTAAGTAPAKVTAGTLMTTPELGAIEYTDNGTTGQFYATVSLATVATRVQIAPSQVGVIGITIDGGGLAITTGVKGYVLVPRAGVITAATLMSTDAATTTGSIIIDVFKGVFGSYPPTVSICSATLPTLSTQKSSQDVTLSSWTKAFAANDVFGFNVTSSPALTRVTLELSVVYT